jgi:hypothetical protein
MTNVIVAESKHNCENLLGEFLDESHFDTLIESDTDCYFGVEDEGQIAFKFRKNYFSKEQQDSAYKGLRDAATQSQNRGLAAGPKGDKCVNREWVTDFQFEALDHLSQLNPSAIGLVVKDDIERIRAQTKSDAATRGYVWLTSETEKYKFNFNNWLKDIQKEKDIISIAEQARDIMDKYISDTTYANPVFSGIAGWFDRYPRIPYARATAYTEKQADKFALSYPFLQQLNTGFKELLPWRWSQQRKAANKVAPEFLVPETVFSTITVNKTFRTAAHRDAGDFSNGLSNLLVLSNNGNFTGGYLILPEVRIAINVRPGDLLLVNNHEFIHGNTPIVLGDDEAERVSLVCYLREGLIGVDDADEEKTRFNFIESRRKNKEHPLWYKLWNGVSPGWEKSEEWKAYLKQHNSRLVNKYFPPSIFDL